MAAIEDWFAMKRKRLRPDSYEAYRSNYIVHIKPYFEPKNGLPHIRFHDLRHTAGSLLINQGQSAKQVQEFLGHEQISTTLDIYTHLTQERKKDTAAAIDSLLSLAE